MLIPTSSLLALVQHVFQHRLSPLETVATASYGAHPVALSPDPPALARACFPEPVLDRPLRAPFFLAGPPNETAWAAGLGGPTDGDQLGPSLASLAVAGKTSDGLAG
jgi:hypothetical protein